MSRALTLYSLAAMLLLAGCSGAVAEPPAATSAAPTFTALPTWTPAPTATARPTYTPAPTYTLYPTYTPPPTSLTQPTCPACPTCTAVVHTSLTPTPATPVESATLLAVVDGDTIRVLLNDREESVRYLAVDCPEVAREERSAEWLADEAARANALLVEGQTLRLEADSPDRDSYGRLLRWVWAGDALVGAELVRQGLAHLSDNAEGSRYAAVLHAAEREAQAGRRGLWGATPTLTARPTLPPTPSATPTAGPCSYIGNASSKIFHRPDCSSVAKMAEHNRVCFATRDEVIAQGYRPCQRCNP